MQAATLIETRSPVWRQLEMLCVQMESGRSAKRLGPQQRIEFAGLYRSACADLALADSYQLPADTVRYLHQLVGRAHNQLYRARSEQTSDWRKVLLEDIPRQIFRDKAVRLATAIFWLPFFASMYLSSVYSPVPNFAETAVGKETLIGMEDMHSIPFKDRMQAGGYQTGRYLFHNTSIGLRCFIWGLVFGIGGLFATLFNAVYIGAVFGHMTTVSDNRLFFEFVTAHGPFELTAVVLASGAGMKMGFALVKTNGLRRIDSLMLAAKDALPIMYTFVALFVGAAFIEGFLSPSNLPYWFKSFVGMMSAMVLLAYFVVLGFSQQVEEGPGARSQGPGNAQAAVRTSPFDEPASSASQPQVSSPPPLAPSP